MKMYEFFSDESKWLQGCLARDADGNEIPPEFDNVTAACLVGAHSFCYRNQREQFSLVWEKLSNRFHHTIVRWNNDPSRTFADIVNLCKELDI